MTREWVRRTHTHTMTEASRQFDAALTTTSSPRPATAQYATILLYFFILLHMCPHTSLLLYSTMCVLILLYCFTSSPPPATAQYALVYGYILLYIACLLLNTAVYFYMYVLILFCFTTGPDFLSFARDGTVCYYICVLMLQYVSSDLSIYVSS